MTLTEEERKNLLAFLDRVSMTGHNERIAMNNLINKIALGDDAPINAPKGSVNESK